MSGLDTFYLILAEGR